jgi:hypothetical protein
MCENVCIVVRRNARQHSGFLISFQRLLQLSLVRFVRHNRTAFVVNRTPNASMTVLFFSLVATSWLHWVLTQPLEPAQHDALMNVYDGLGSFA